MNVAAPIAVGAASSNLEEFSGTCATVCIAGGAKKERSWRRRSYVQFTINEVGGLTKYGFVEP